MFPKPAKYRTIFKSREYLNYKTLFCEFEFIEPKEMEFLAGQFINLNIGASTFRSYSICSNPANKSSIFIIASVEHEGVGAKFLKHTQLGSEVEIIGPSGRFVLPPVLSSVLIFIATGTGVAPILSMMDVLAEQNITSVIILYFGIRKKDDLFMINRLNEFEKKLKHFRYYVCFSQDLETTFGNTHYLKGRVSDYVDFKNKEAQYFLCGNPNMVSDTLNKLAQNNTPETSIFHEKFTLSQR